MYFMAKKYDMFGNVCGGGLHEVIQSYTEMVTMHINAYHTYLNVVTKHLFA